MKQNAKQQYALP